MSIEDNEGNRVLTGLKDGNLSDKSSDAVTGTQLYTTDQNVTTNANNISELTNGTIGIVKQDSTSKEITVASGTGGTSVSIKGTNGVRTLSGVKDCNDQQNL